MNFVEVLLRLRLSRLRVMVHFWKVWQRIPAVP